MECNTSFFYLPHESLIIITLETLHTNGMEHTFSQNLSSTWRRMHPATISSNERACNEIHKTTEKRNDEQHANTHLWLSLGTGTKESIHC